MKRLALPCFIRNIAYHSILFRCAIVQAAATIVIAHTHPSGNADPSEQDKVVTKAICEAGRIVQIQVQDHVIVASDEWYSFAYDGLL